MLPVNVIFTWSPLGSSKSLVLGLVLDRQITFIYVMENLFSILTLDMQIISKGSRGSCFD